VFFAARWLGKHGKNMENTWKTHGKHMETSSRKHGKDMERHGKTWKELEKSTFRWKRWGCRVNGVAMVPFGREPSKQKIVYPGQQTNRNHQIWLRKECFPVDFPLNQSMER
jgi:hypothetical protein